MAMYQVEMNGSLAPGDLTKKNVEHKGRIFMATGAELSQKAAINQSNNINGVASGLLPVFPLTVPACLLP
jgi:hypothetical protein